MRNDLNKQLCEHERYGSSNSFREVRHMHDFTKAEYGEDGEFEGVGSAGREGMKFRYRVRGNYKTFGEHLNPLWGFVRKSVGRKWDDVYSEICQVFDKRSTINQHILDHLFQHVETHVKVGDDGNLYTISGYRRGVVGMDEWYSEYYVDPRDGILKINKHYRSYKQNQRERAKERERERLKVCRVIDKFTELHKLDGVWFEVKFREQEGKRVAYESPANSWRKRPYTYYRIEYNYVFDVLKQQTVYEKRYAFDKRTLSKKELRQHKLV